MTITLIIIAISCIFLLLAYIFDLTSYKIKIPSIILLLFSGWIIRELTFWFKIQLPDFSSLLPILATIGFISIVLKASLELKLDKSEIIVIRKCFSNTLISVLIFIFLLGLVFKYLAKVDFKVGLINAILLSNISSAIAIPSVKDLPLPVREFVIYESSFTDILVILLFNLLTSNSSIEISLFGQFFLQLLIMIIISFISTIILLFLLNKIENRVKFVPIILLVVLIYTISQILFLPGLIFIMFFGLFIANIDKWKKIGWVERFIFEGLKEEVNKFQELVIEGEFLVRSLFFLLFGYFIDTKEILNIDTLLLALVIVFLIYLVRAIQLKISGLSLKPLLFIAPRGLLTILLFLSIESAHSISFVNKSLITQVVILTSLIMTFGLMINKSEEKVSDTSINSRL